MNFPVLPRRGKMIDPIISESMTESPYSLLLFLVYIFFYIFFLMSNPPSSSRPITTKMEEIFYILSFFLPFLLFRAVSELEENGRSCTKA